MKHAFIAMAGLFVCLTAYSAQRTEPLAVAEVRAAGDRNIVFVTTEGGADYVDECATDQWAVNAADAEHKSDIEKKLTSAVERGGKAVFEYENRCSAQGHHIAGAVEVVGPELTFAAIADIPYSSAAQVAFEGYISRLNDMENKPRFLVHLGDIKAGKASGCEERYYEYMRSQLTRLNFPAFLVPGDNEYNDCDDPQAAFGHWKTHFLGLETHWPDGPDVVRQPARKENFSFFENDVLLIGINLVGGRVHDKKEWVERIEDNIEWIEGRIDKYADRAGAMVLFAHAKPDQDSRKKRPYYDIFIHALRQKARGLETPVLFLHGDKHDWEKEYTWSEENIFRVMVDGGHVEADEQTPPLPVIVTVRPWQDEPFSFNRNPF
jgi:hypothetical protein